MNVYTALAGYLILVVFYSYELSEHLQVLNFRRVLISLLAVFGYGFLVCHFVLEAGLPQSGDPLHAACSSELRSKCS